jgi:hypothetical protein
MIVICTSVRNESRILEWVNYYYKIGIGHIILLDDNDHEDNTIEKSLESIDPSLFTIIKDKIKNNLEHIKCNYSHSKEHWIINIQPRLTQLNATYLFKIDADEFLHLNKFKNIQEMIKFYEPFDAILINWLIFGGCYLKKNDKNTITDVFTKSDNKLHFHIKSLARVSSIIDFNNNAHSFRLQDNSIIKDIDNNIVKFNQDSKKSIDITSHKLPEMSYKNRIYIAHYINQDYYTFVQRKFLDNISEVYFSHDFFKYIDANDKVIFKDYFMKYTELSLDYMNALHLSMSGSYVFNIKNSDLKGHFNTPNKRKFKNVLSAITEYYYLIDRNGNKIDNEYIKNSKLIFGF